MMDILMEYAGILALVAGLLLTLITGSIIERRHFRSLEAREKATLLLPVVSRETISDPSASGDARMVSGSCVVAADFFKRHLAGLRNFFGGRVGAYESLIDRARREAILRMRAQADGAVEIACTRITTSNIGRGMVEAIAYGTAVFPTRGE